MVLNFKRHNVKNHSAAQANARFASPDFAARMHFIVIGRISIEQRLIRCFSHPSLSSVATKRNFGHLGCHCFAKIAFSE